ncbi:MAG: hypothetical protein ACKN9T_08250 [Candidatus Methylumidiphilus sp.]
MSKVFVPHLQEKLRLLCKLGRNPAITQHNHLAESLGITAPSISQWIKAECLPDERMQEMLQLFALTQEVFLLDNMAAFRAEVEAPKLPPASPWEKLCAQAVSVEKFDHPRGGLELPRRGISFYVDDGRQGPTFRIGDQFRLRIEGPKDWHVAVFLQDPKGIACLCPHEELGENNQLALPSECQGRKSLMLPNEGCRPFRVEPPVGQHWWVVAFVAEPLPVFLTACLRDASGVRLPDALTQLNWELDRLSDKDSFVLRLPFWVLED